MTELSGSISIKGSFTIQIKQFRKGLNQIAENPGGIFIDISENEMKIDEMKEIALKKAIRRSRFGSDIIIVKGNQYKAYRIQK
ncbi:MAG: hypothetical protein IJT16_02065 [Lachnospiraceae bacterium]|nr:hypothetical protein [Lachnospiraceae bacterium]